MDDIDSAKLQWLRLVHSLLKAELGGSASNSGLTYWVDGISVHFAWRNQMFDALVAEDAIGAVIGEMIPPCDPSQVRPATFAEAIAQAIQRVRAAVH